MRNVPSDSLACRKSFALHAHAEPPAEFFRVGQCPPDTGTRGFQQYLALNAISVAHMHPPSCILTVTRNICNSLVAFLRATARRVAAQFRYGCAQGALRQVLLA